MSDYSDPPTLHDVSDMFKEYSASISELKRRNADPNVSNYCPEMDHPEYCECQVSKKLNYIYDSAVYHWEEAMERAREEGEQKRQRDSEEFAALKAKRREALG